MRNLNMEIDRFQNMLVNQVENGLRITSRQAKYLKRLQRKQKGWER